MLQGGRSRAEWVSGRGSVSQGEGKFGKAERPNGIWIVELVLRKAGCRMTPDGKLLRPCRSARKKDRLAVVRVEQLRAAAGLTGFGPNPACQPVSGPVSGAPGVSIPHHCLKANPAASLV